MSTSRAHYLAMALVACATLLFEIGLTRLLSVVLWYHYAFLVVSLALLGLGSPGVWFAVQKPSERVLGRSLLVAGALIPLSVVWILKLGSTMQDWPLVWVVVLMLPFFALGSAVCLFLLRAAGAQVSRMYAADLGGATLGAVLMIPLLHMLPTPVLVCSAGLLPLAAAALVDREHARKPAALIALAILSLMIARDPLQVTYTKAYREIQPPLFERWTPTARLAVFEASPLAVDPKGVAGWGWGASRWGTEAKDVKQRWLEQDGSAGSPITRFDRQPAQMQYLLYDVTSVGYQIGAPERVCVIGVGGGRDVLAALAAGATSVDAVELNGGIVDLMSHELKEYSGDVYHLPGVYTHVDEGRSFLARSKRRYDVIQISLTDTWAATAAGAYALSENNLYTVEAMRLYYQRLSQNGVLSISRWARGERQMEMARLAILAVHALSLERAAGEGWLADDPRAHIAIVQARQVAALLVSRKPFDPARLAELDGVIAKRGFARLWPAQTPSSLPGHVLAHGDAELTKAGFDLSPPTDDRPFFFQTIPLLGRVKGTLDRFALSPNEQAVLQLRKLVSITALFAVLLFFAPLALRRHLPRGSGFWPGALYFGAIGLGFMLIEMPLIEILVVYLGQPSYAAAHVLGTLLLGAGIGSFLSGRVSPDVVQSRALLLPLTAAVTVAVLSLVLPATMGSSLLGRGAIAFALLFPCALLLGFAFPSGMLRFGDESKAWFWAINGVFGVAASVLSLALAILLGFKAVLAFGIVAYVLAARLLRARPGV